ncbi:MAG: hypothetical protein M0Q43_01360 [Methanothrix sp.]|nr:hypothetical protein [Methanothrix sp.]
MDIILASGEGRPEKDRKSWLGITEFKCHVWRNTHKGICIDSSLSGASYTAHLHKPPIHPLFELQQLPLS